MNVKIHVHIYFAVISNVSYTFGYIKKPLVCVEFEYNRNAKEKGFYNRRQVGNNLKERQLLMLEKSFNKAQKDGYLPPREGTTKRPPVPGPVGNPVGKVPRGSIGPVIKRENDRMQMQ